MGFFYLFYFLPCIQSLHTKQICYQLDAHSPSSMPKPEFAQNNNDRIECRDHKYKEGFNNNNPV